MKTNESVVYDTVTYKKKGSMSGNSVDNTIRSRQGSGLCLDFPQDDVNSQYYVGTEDGIVHKCSVSYNEQVLKTYYGHTGPVYKICCSPFDPNKFLTCSSDWTVKIWDEHQSTPLVDLQSGLFCLIFFCSTSHYLIWSLINICGLCLFSRY